MNVFTGQVDLPGFGLDHFPLVEVRPVSVSRPTLRDNTGLADRLSKATAAQFGLSQVSLPLSLASHLPGWFKEYDQPLWVAVHHRGEIGRIVALGRPESTEAYGLAVDVGSTTLVLALVNMSRATVVDTLSVTNPQIEYGADVLTRAHMAERPGGLAILTGGLRQAINNGLVELCGRYDLSPNCLLAGVVAGNAIMTHFLLGLPTATLIREPYVPVMNRPGLLSAEQIGLGLTPEAPMLIMPIKGAYFGGDLIAGLVASGLARSEATGLLVDVGTNAEVVLGQKDWLIGAAGAAGPALEGGVARMGMVAGPGVIDWVRIDRESKEVSFRTIDGLPPRGICGSGLIDLMAELFLSGLIDFRGRLTLLTGHPRRVETDEGPAFVVAFAHQTATGQPITLSEVEMDILTRSKAGMFTIIGTVLLSVGLRPEDLDRFFVAGTFGQYIDPVMAVALGLVPDIPLDRFVPLGNSSLKGAVLALLSAQARTEADEVHRRLTYLEMNVNQDLMNRFSAARFIPHTDRRLFPSVGVTIR